MLPELFLALADELVADGDPAKCRSAISRAYYAVYNVAERCLQRMKFQRPKSNYHVVLQQRLLGSGDAEFIQIGSDLGDFHQERIQADYHMNDRVAENPHNAAAAVKKARRMIDALENCPVQGSRWKSIQASIAKVNVTGTDKVS
jgi:hypothetical protein